MRALLIPAIGLGLLGMLPAQAPLSPATELALTKMELAQALFETLQLEAKAQNEEFQKWRAEACASEKIDLASCEIDLKARKVSRRAEPAPAKK